MAACKVSEGTDSVMKRLRGAGGSGADGSESRLPYALMFAGQGSGDWRRVLDDACADASVRSFIENLERKSQQVLEPVASDMLAVSPDAADAGASASVPGIVRAQAAMLAYFDAATSPLLASHRPEAVLGHSQGAFAARIAEAYLDHDQGAAARWYALSRIVGAAAALQGLMMGIAAGSGDHSPMLSVKGVPEADIVRIASQILGRDIQPAVVNARDHVVFSGMPSDMARLAAGLRARAQRAEAERSMRGGTAFAPVVEFLGIDVPFHSPLMQPAVERSVQWAVRCGFAEDEARSAAERVLTKPEHWNDRIAEALDTCGIRWFVDLGPGSVLGDMTASLLEGSGAGIIETCDVDSCEAASMPDYAPVPSGDWHAHMPKLTTLPDGRTVLDTAFTRLTGRSAIMLGAMTPTTADPAIVAAAANAGHWAELAGGGQVAESLFYDRMRRLHALLEPGVAVQFNTMVMDPHLWRLHFGARNIVGRVRRAGAPIDGVTLSAGLPDDDKAAALIDRLHRQGFPYVSLKVGAVRQIRRVVALAKAHPDMTIILQVEDGRGGGHHSWESLDDMLLSQYAAIRRCRNLVLAVGGGFGTPDKAARYLTGAWSAAYGMRPMPVDAVFVGTAAMTCAEALTSPSVKQALVNASGADDGAWVHRDDVRGGVTSGVSSLHADLYELENAASRCARLLRRISDAKDADAAAAARRDEIVAAMNATAKPYFGDVAAMTYAAWLRRYAQLAHPWADPTIGARFVRMIERCERRLTAQDHGSFAAAIDAEAALDDPLRAIADLERVYPLAAVATVSETDAAWFVDLCDGADGKGGKPVPFVPVIDGQVARRWGQDAMWQSQDPRYDADQVIVSAGPTSVAHVDRVDEPVALLLGRFEQGCVDALLARGCDPVPAFARRADAQTGKPAATQEEFVRSSPLVFRSGHLTTHAAAQPRLAAHASLAPADRDNAWQETMRLDHSYWDRHDGGADAYAVRELAMPFDVPAHAADGAYPVTDEALLADDMQRLQASMAGVGTHDACGNSIDALPAMVPSSRSPFGEYHADLQLTDDLGAQHFAATIGRLPDYLVPAQTVPDAFMCLLWPSIYAGIGSGATDGERWLDSLQSTIHLSHEVRFRRGINADDVMARYRAMRDDGEQPRLHAVSWTDRSRESASGRILEAHIELSLRGLRATAAGQGSDADAGCDGPLVSITERFIVPSSVYAGDPLPSIEPYGGALTAAAEGGRGEDGKTAARRVLRRFQVQAPADMTAFERVTGDYNPLHVSRVDANIAGYDEPIVNGMWLSAAAQQAVASTNVLDGSRGCIEGWTYSMAAPVRLGSVIDVTVERVGRASQGRTLLEVTCKSGGELVAQASVIVGAPATAYVFPGQGSQRQGMGMVDYARSAAARDVWNRADRHTRKRFGFSILSIVRDNPQSIVVRGTTYRHPKGVLFLSQFTQVALTVLGFAQFAQFEAEGAIDRSHAYIAGHSLGEYTALSVVGNAFSLETVIDMVYQRGNTMYELVDRDEHGRSNYGMGALRPAQFGVDDDRVDEYVDGVSQRCGEFLQIVNYNVAGQQYAVVGTIKGLRLLREDAERRAKEYGGKPPYMAIPGIDVPFHSRLMRPGVPKYREKLQSMIPEDDDCRGLIGHYIPNLVARPFALTREFAEAILDVAPSQPVKDALATEESWQWWQEHPQQLSRMLFIELLAWQFASPVRWIETQRLLFAPKRAGGLGVERFVEVGLAAAPVLANMAVKTLRRPEFADVHVQVLNAERDADRVLGKDTDPAPGVEEIPEAGEGGDVAQPAVAGASAGAADAGAAPAATAPSAADVRPSAVAASGAADSAGAADAASDIADLPFTAADAVAALLAQENGIRPDQIGEDDTLETLTNGVSSKRNQQLVDIAAEISVPSLEGAAEATVAKLRGMVNKAAGAYRPFGSVLDESVNAHIHELFGPARVPQSHIADRLNRHWRCSGGWVPWTMVELLLGARDGSSLRGGDLRTLPGDAVTTPAEADALIDAAVMAVAERHGIGIAPVAAAAAGGGVVDSAALLDYEATVTGPDGVLASAARTVLHQLGLDEPADEPDDDDAAADARVVALVERELGSDWARTVAPTFDSRKAVLFDDRWASAREDLARLRAAGSLGEDPLLGGAPSFLGAGDAVADQAHWWADRCERDGNAELAAQYRDIAEQAAADDRTLAQTLAYDGKVALITGATPRSIAGAVSARFLAGGATVIITASHIDWKRLQFARDLYRRHAAGHARLWLVPANLSSYGDVDALIDWVTSEQKQSVGAVSVLLKPALMPDFFLPFAAPHVSGLLDQAGPASERQMRLLLWSVERGIADLAHARESVDVAHRTMVVLPGSGNRGTFGGDGAYGEAKSAFDAIERKWKSEPGWHDRILLAQPTIGWVRGTGLMAQNDPLVSAVEAKGVRTFSTAEIADRLMELCTPQSVEAAAHAPIHANLTGGVGEVDMDLAAVTSQFIADFREQQEEERRQREAAASDADDATAPRTLTALPAPATAGVRPLDVDARVADARAWGAVHESLDDMVVVVGTGLIGPWGSGRTAAEAELGIRYDGTADMTAAGVIELAWSMGLIIWQDAPKRGWVDAASGDLIDEADIYERFHDEVVARCGVRRLEADGEVEPDGDEQLPSVYLSSDVSFDVPDRAAAEEYRAADPEHTAIAPNERTGEWTVTRKAGSEVRVPRRKALLRHVAAQIPRGFDPARWGLPPAMLESLDEVSLWSMLTTVDAFLASGFTPAEILQSIHPADFASTQSTGIGGARSSMTMLQQYLSGRNVSPDLFAEVMPNIIGGHVMQSYLGGYGEINTPIGACATAAVSLEEAVDKIRLGKADFAVTGGSDDISRGSVFGFGNMSATADDAALSAEGIADRFMSRPDDRRRAGFIESQGGGTVLVARASLALRMGLPVLAVVGYARTFADGAHSSIPAPGIGALAAGRGGRHGELVRRLGKLGLTADDIAVVCKHDTSTVANDANESEIHRRLAHAIGRTPGNPLFVYSPKALTGHAKGGSFVFQTSDIVHMFERGTVPANMSLDCVDPSMRRDDELVWVRNEPLDLAAAGVPIRAVIATSLGFGHVSSVVVFADPAAFEAAVLASGSDSAGGEALLRQWLERSHARLMAGARRLDAGMHGHAPLYEPIESRHLHDVAGEDGTTVDAHDVEARMLLDDDARLGADGFYR